MRYDVQIEKLVGISPASTRNDSTGTKVPAGGGIVFIAASVTSAAIERPAFVVFPLGGRNLFGDFKMPDLFSYQEQSPQLTSLVLMPTGITRGSG